MVVLVHGAVLASVLWLARKPEPPSALPQSAIGLVLTPRDANIAPALPVQTAQPVADVAPDPLALASATPDHPEITPLPAPIPPVAPAVAPVHAAPLPTRPPSARTAGQAETHRPSPPPAPGEGSPAAAVTARLSAQTLPPRPIGTLAANPPTYPETARRRGEQGEVMLRVNVGTDGLPLAVTVGRSSGHASLDDAAIGAVRQWRFHPATRDGQPVVATAEVPVQFRLEN